MPDASARGIFLSYRREDAAPYARLLQYQLSERFPDARLFMDLDSIEAGLDFAEVIRDALDSSAVLVALIGRQWATVADEQGRRRLDDPDDYVRFEVQTALKRGVRVIPVLVDNARPLRQEQLPAELHKLARLNALDLSYGRYQDDVDRLLDFIERVLAPEPAQAEAERPEQQTERLRQRLQEQLLRELLQEDERRIQKEAERKASDETEYKAPEEAARRETEEQARREAENKARQEAEEQARRAAEDQARREAEDQARREAEQREAERRAAEREAARPTEALQRAAGRERPPKPITAGGRKRLRRRRSYVKQEQRLWELEQQRQPPQGRPSYDPAPRIPEGPTVQIALEGDRVECSVFAPPMVSPGSVFLVQAFAHISSQTREAIRRAKEFDADAVRRAIKTLESSVPRGTKLSFDLTIPGLRVVDPVQSLVWWGAAESVQFGVSVPKRCRPGNVVGTLTVSQDWIPLGHIKFTLSVTADPRRPLPSISAVGEAARHYEMAFISYASQDRATVLERVQVLPTVGIRTFQDVLNLEPGERWERSLYRHIDESDIVLLFWSNAAKKSKWVRKEVRYALDRKHGDELAPPEIGPVIIEGPPVPRPWKELAYLHFNDPRIYIIDR